MEAPITLTSKARGTVDGRRIFSSTLSNASRMEEETAEGSYKLIADNLWLEAAFSIEPDQSDVHSSDNRFYSTAHRKFTDTSLGGNIGINPKPQFTQYADVRIKGRRNDATSQQSIGPNMALGQGRFYSEKFDDNAMNLYLKFGTPKFNSLFTFFTRAIDYKSVIVATTGRYPLEYDIAKSAGSFATFLVLPVISLAIWTIGLVDKIITGSSSLNYYYLNPAMHVYWSTVSNIVTSIATEAGILIPDFMGDKLSDSRIGITLNIDKGDLDEMRKLMPGIISERNYIDVFAIATKAQRLADEQYRVESEVEYVNQAETPSAGGNFADQLNQTVPTSVRTEWFENWVDGFKSELLDDWKIATDVSNGPVDAAESSATATSTDGKYQYGKDGGIEESTGYVMASSKELADNTHGKMTNAFTATMRGGAGHAIFKVDYPGTTTYTFSNSTTNIPSADGLKSIGQTAKSTMFTSAGGNIVDGAGDVLRGVTNTVMGALDGATFGLSNVIAGLFGGAYIDMPQMWDDSTTDVPAAEFTIDLVSPYGNTISQLMNLYIPLAMLLAGSAPISTGASSYTSPFLCSAFLKGFHNIKLGIITSFKVERGTTNLGYSKAKRPLALKVSFTIADLSNILKVPVDTSLFTGSFKTGLDDDSLYSRFISTLVGRDLLTDMYALPKARMRVSRLLMGYDRATSPNFWGYRVGSMIEPILGAFQVDHAISLNDRRTVEDNFKADTSPF